MKIYTRTGDKGSTGLYGNKRVSKCCINIEAIGDIDELNALIGVCKVQCKDADLANRLEVIQNWLFECGAQIATPLDHPRFQERITEEQIGELESTIDSMEETLPPLTNFVLPGGSILSSYLHLARATCRRAERSIVKLQQDAEISEYVPTFLNRLSDWLFVAARYANKLEIVSDVKWLGEKKSILL